jgi:hypothetical protein
LFSLSWEKKSKVLTRRGEVGDENFNNNFEAFQTKTLRDDEFFENQLRKVCFIKIVMNLSRDKKVAGEFRDENRRRELLFETASGVLGLRLFG